MTPGDIVWWTGLGARNVRPALKQLEEVTVPVEVEGSSSRCLLHVDDHLALSQPDRGTAQPAINFLPELDPYLMGRLYRQAMLDSDRVRYVTDRSGNVTSTIVINGRVSEVWDITDAPGPPRSIRYRGRGSGIPDRKRLAAYLEQGVTWILATGWMGEMSALASTPVNARRIEISDLSGQSSSCGPSGTGGRLCRCLSTGSYHRQEAQKPIMS